MKQKFFHRTGKKIPLLVIAAILCAGTALAGCSRSSTTTVEETTVITEEAGGEVTVTTVTEDLDDLKVEEEPVSAIEGEPTSSEGILSYDVEELSTEQQAMLGPMGALIYAYEDAGNTTPTWADSGWDAVSELFNYWGPDYVDGSGRVTGDVSEIRISEDFLKEAASVMFPDYDGSLPTIDANEETAGFQPEEDGYYPYTFSDRGEGAEDFSFETWTKYEDGTCEVTVQAMDYMGGTTTYRFTLAPRDDTTQADPIFTYDVTEMEKEE